MTRCVAWALAAAVLTWSSGLTHELIAAQTRNSIAHNRYALLVGCTRYQNNEQENLRGPANDVVLMRKVLVEQFGFPQSDIIILSEAAGAKSESQRPTRAAIEREFHRLADKARQGDQVVILLAGHGGQQPADIDIPGNYEPDGLDETFFPADVGPWTSGKEKIPNAIIDNELSDWLKAIRARGASVWVTVDSCHSGTLVRGGLQETRRFIASDVFMPRDVFERGRKRGIQAAAAMQAPPSRSVEESPFKLPVNVPELVAIYAAESHDTEIELPLPRESPDRKCHGLLTFTLCQELMQAQSPLTYSELVQRVQARYVQMGRHSPIPLIEGTDRHKEVLGFKEWPNRSRVLLTSIAPKGYRLNAGAIQGLSEGSILAVFPPAGQTDAQRRLGHVRVTECRVFDSGVQPCEHDGPRAPSHLPDQARCEAVYIDYGSLQLRVAVDAEANAIGTGRGLVEEAVRRIALRPKSLIGVASRAEADWLVNLESGKVRIIPATGFNPSGGIDLSHFGPASVDDAFESWLANRLDRIARARNLLRIAAVKFDDEAKSTGIDVSVELLQFQSADATEGTVVQPQARGFVFRDGDIVAFRVTNRSRSDIYISLLFVDSGFGIEPVFPRPGIVGENRLASGKAYVSARSRVKAKRPAADHMVLIATSASGSPTDFSWLAQSSLEPMTRGSGSTGIQSPLDRLLQSAMYAEGGVRGGRGTSADSHRVQLVSWIAQPRASTSDFGKEGNP